MTSVDKFLIILRSAVGLVYGEIEVGIVTPRIVSIELVDRKKLDGIHAKFLQVGEFIHGQTDIAVASRLTFRTGEITEQKLIYDKIVF